MHISTRRATATERFHAQARKKRARPVVLLLAGIGVVFLGIVGFILFGGTERPELILDRFEALRSAGAELQGRDRCDEAAAKYREAIALAEGDEKFRSSVADLRARLRELAARKAALKETRERFDAWKEKVAKRKAEDVTDLILQGTRLLSEVETASVPWRTELKADLESLEKERRDREAANPSFETVRERIRSKFLALRDWGGAVGAWKAWLPTEGGRKDGKRAEEEIAKIHQWAREEFDAIRRKSERLVKAEALRLVEGARPRFGLTPSEGDLEKLRLELTR